jgi:hypothetical protein
MRIVQREKLNEEQWNGWLDNYDGVGVFSTLSYLDARCEKLCFVINEDSSGGMALPFKERFGVKTLYTPKFMRYVSWIGAKVPDRKKFREFLKDNFEVAEIFTSSFLLHAKPRQYSYQLKTDPGNYRTQAKRKVKEGLKKDWLVEFGENFQEAQELIKYELLPYIPSLDAKDFDDLLELTEALGKEGLIKCLMLRDRQGRMKGAHFYLIDKHRWVYLKGACARAEKAGGGNYYLIHHGIEACFAEGKIFDFGGSRIEGVKRFNRTFNTENGHYYHFRWNIAPFWYKTLKYFRNKWTKK